MSYDPTRELYQAINPAFVKTYEARTGSSVEVRQSHAGSSYQARRVAGGELAADVVTLGLPSDVDGLRKRGLIAENWRDRLPNESRPYVSTVVFVVRKGNPHAVRDWPDLLKPGLEVIFPTRKPPATASSPCSRHGARWSRAAARPMCWSGSISR